jgi:membrane protein DedA with SNARE-associated domain
MIEHYAQSLAQFLQAHPHLGGLVTFFIAFLESLPVFGTIIPGSVTMTALGILVGRAIMPLGNTLLWATLGAFLGDLIGYGLGSYYNVRLRNMWPFKIRPQWLESGEKFFHKHGGKSILIGRFFGPLRSIIPMIAGLLHMPWLRFVIAAIPSAAFWAALYLLPGVLLGALSLQLPPKVATKFVLLLLSLIILASIFAWLFKLIFSKFMNTGHRLMKQSWDYLRAREQFTFLTRAIANEDHPENYHQLTWLIFALVFALLFLVLFSSVIEENSLVIFNKPVFELLRSMRHPYSDRFFVAVTLLGDGMMLSISGFIIFIWLYFQKRHRDAFYWAAAIAIFLIVPNIIKNLIYFPRPSGLLHASSTSSFPSGHTFFSIVYYGFLATLIGTHLPTKYRRYPYTIAATLISLVAISRVYLGAHWLTDVLASLFLGYTFLALLTLFYRRKVVTISVKKLTILAVTVTVAVWMCVLVLTYQKNMLRYTLLWPSKTVTEAAWWEKTNPALPIFRENRLGKPTEPMNVQYAGDLQQLKSLLLSQGWQTNTDVTLLKTTLQKLVPAQGNSTPTSILPSLYLNNPPILYMIKNSGETKLVLRLWDSNIYLAESFNPLYIGNIVEYQENGQKTITTYSFNATSNLLVYLHRTRWRTSAIATTKIPKNLKKKKWNGEILQISAPAFY